MSDTAIRDVHWKTELSLSRREVKTLAKLAGYVGNIESHLSGGFDAWRDKDADFEVIRNFFAKINSLNRKDDEMYEAICKKVKELNE